MKEEIQLKAALDVLEDLRAILFRQCQGWPMLDHIHYLDGLISGMKWSLAAWDEPDESTQHYPPRDPKVRP